LVSDLEGIEKVSACKKEEHGSLRFILLNAYNVYTNWLYLLNNLKTNNMKKRFWITSQGLLATTTGSMGIGNAEEISKAKYYRVLKEQKRMSIELDENGITISDDGTLYLKGFK